MRKKFTIFLILIFTFFIVIHVVKATGDTISTSSIDQLANGSVFGNFLEKAKNIIGFVDENLAGIIVLCLACYLFCKWIYNYIHNRRIKKQYKRENNDNDKKFKTMRCEDDGDEKRRHNVYLINVKSTPKTYQLIADYYTLKELGYGGASRKDNDKLFSKNDYEIKSRIKINNTFLDIANILKFKNDLK